MRPPAPPTHDDDELEPAADDPVGDGKETFTLYELPPIFVTADGDNSATVKKIEVVYVYKKLPSKQISYIDWRPIAELSDLKDLLEQFGAGTYCLQGRAHNRVATVKQIYHTVGSDTAAEIIPSRGAPARGELDVAKLATGIVAIASPILAIMTDLMDRRDKARAEDRHREEERRSDERRREDDRNQAFMTTMSQLMTARNSDLEAMVRAGNEARVVAAAPPAARLNDAFQDGQASVLEIIRTVKEEGLAGEDMESRVLGIVEAFATGKKKADADDAAPAAPNGAPT